MTPAQAALLTQSVNAIVDEIRSIRGLLADSMDRIFVALGRV